MTITKNVWKIAALLLILSLISAVMISGTYAKYTSTYAGEDTALVAKWEVLGSGDGSVFTSGGAIALNLFSHALHNNITASEGGVYIIAPGVNGNFALQFENNSDVAANIEFGITPTGSALTVPIEYSLDNFSTAAIDVDELETALNGGSSIFDNVAANAAVATQIVYWRWAFNGDDAVDTGLGTASAAANRTTYGLSITASAVQVIPN